jgi:hypothetical protein
MKPSDTDKSGGGMQAPSPADPPAGGDAGAMPQNPNP